MNPKETPEYKSYKNIKNWSPSHQILSPSELLLPLSKIFPLFSYLYNKTQDVYAKMPPRKNGESPFIHPINVVSALKEAGVTDEIALCSGLIHDLIEEKVDIYKNQQHIKDEKKQAQKLDEYELKAFNELEKEL